MAISLESAKAGAALPARIDRRNAEARQDKWMFELEKAMFASEPKKGEAEAQANGKTQGEARSWSPASAFVQPQRAFEPERAEREADTAAPQVEAQLERAADDEQSDEPAQAAPLAALRLDGAPISITVPRAAAHEAEIPVLAALASQQPQGVAELQPFKFASDVSVSDSVGGAATIGTNAPTATAFAAPAVGATASTAHTVPAAVRPMLDGPVGDAQAPAQPSASPVDGAATPAAAMPGAGAVSTLAAWRAPELLALAREVVAAQAALVQFSMAGPARTGLPGAGVDGASTAVTASRAAPLNALRSGMQLVYQTPAQGEPSAPAVADMAEVPEQSGHTAQAEGKPFEKRSLHVYLDGDAIHAWIRDSDIGAAQLRYVAQAVASEFAATGKTLAVLTVNGKVVDLRQATAEPEDDEAFLMQDEAQDAGSAHPLPKLSAKGSTDHAN